MTNYRVNYRVTLKSSIDFSADDMPTAADAARDYLRRTYGTDIVSVQIESVRDQEVTA